MSDISTEREPALPSPCVGICQINRETRHCLGCLRSIEEIAGWARADNAERLEILERLRQRREAAGDTRRRKTRRRIQAEARSGSK